jgi:Membrane protein putatively involved in post-translational modification of the autoinducing quorum-sensing peptide
MEKICNNIADKLAVELKYDNDTKEVIAYGIFAVLNIITSVLLVILFGAIFKVEVESLIICFTGSILRKYSGGAHANSPSTCAIIGTIICIGQATLIKFFISAFISIEGIMVLGMVIFIESYYLVYKLAPVDSIAKPIKKKEKKERMKKGSIYALNCYLIIIIINTLLYNYYLDNRLIIYSLCIFGGIAWQIFTLTKVGHRAMNKMDTFLNQILTINKGGV